MSILASTFRWLQRKRYQYEVTFSLYMLTPTEKVIFNTFIFLFFSMIVVACSLYLPQHITFLANRAWFYYFGDDEAVPNSGSAKAVTTALGNAAASTSVEVGRRLRDAVESARAGRGQGPALPHEGVKMEL